MKGSYGLIELELMPAADGEIRQGLPMSYLEFKTWYTSNRQSYLLESDISTQDFSARAQTMFYTNRTSD